MTGTVPFFQLESTDLFEILPVPRDNQNQPLLAIRQHEPLLFVTVPTSFDIEDLDRVRLTATCRRLKHGSGYRIGMDKPVLRVELICSEVAVDARIFASGSSEDERRSLGQADGVTSIVVRVVT